MSEVRHHTNLKPDYEPDMGIPQIPETEIKLFIVGTIKDLEDNFKAEIENACEGIYMGTAGIAYMYYHLSKVKPLDRQGALQFLDKVIEYIKPALDVAEHSKNITDRASLFFGHGGTYVIGATIYKIFNYDTKFEEYKDKFYSAAAICKEEVFLKSGSDELFLGRAGYIMGALWFAKETNTPLQMEDITTICKTIMASGRKHSKLHNSLCPLMFSYYKVEYFGAAHGLSSILLALLSVPGYLDANPTDAADVKQSIDYLLSLQTPEGNFPTTTADIDLEPTLVQWCHGATGIFYLMAKAYLTYKDEKYMASCRKITDAIWSKGLSKKGPGLCHGISGNAYVFLIMYRLTKEIKFQYRALCFYKFMKKDGFKNEDKVPENPYSLFEGLAGTCCFVADLLDPQNACFPFIDIFFDDFYMKQNKCGIND